jgi:hypothetical protein
MASTQIDLGGSCVIAQLLILSAETKITAAGMPNTVSVYTPMVCLPVSTPAAPLEVATLMQPRSGLPFEHERVFSRIAQTTIQAARASLQQYWLLLGDLTASIRA